MKQHGSFYLKSLFTFILGCVVLLSYSVPAFAQSCEPYFTPTVTDGSSPTVCDSGYVVDGIECDGRYCDNKRLRCVPYTESCEPDPEAEINDWSLYITNNPPNTSYIDPDEFLMGLRCDEDYCDNVSLQTFSSPFLPNPGEEFCEWSPYFSEEAGFRDCSSAYVSGLRCSGYYCDDISMYCCANPYADVEVVDVEYYVDEYELAENPPMVLVAKTVENCSSAQVSQGFTVNKSVTETSLFQNTIGVGLEVGQTFSVGIPFVSGESSISISSAAERTYGIEESYQQGYEAIFTVTVPPYSAIEADAVVFNGNLDVPYTMLLRSPSTGQEFTREGISKGVTIWDLHSEANDIKDFVCGE